MAYNFKRQLGKRSVAILLVLSVVSSSLLPFLAPKKAEAFLGFGDLVIDVQAFAERLLDYAAQQVAQRMVDEMVKSSIRWANEGFNGNPAYVTDPTSYFGNIANGMAGDFILKSDVGFLCSPLQNVNLRISLAKYYTQPYQPQCTLTGIVGNIDNFYDHFEGGWDAFIQVTQNSSNNPYGSFIDAQIELDKRLQKKLGLEDKKLDWNAGFKSKGDCITTYHAPTGQQIEDYENGVSGPGTIAGGDIPYSETLQEGECAEYGPDKTPGSVIKSGLDKALPSGLEKLITVEHVDQLVSAFANGLLTRYVFGPKGLFGTDYADGFNAQGNLPINRPQQLDCLADTQTATVNETLVNYTALSNLGGLADYIWSGEGVDNASSSSVSVVYNTSGTKTAIVTASSTDSNGLHHERTASCPNVVVSKSTPLIVSCSAKSGPVINYNTPVQWEANITGGSGKFVTIQWDGQQGYVPGKGGSDDDEYRIWPHDIADPNVPFVAWLYGSDAGNHGTASTDPKYKNQTVAYGLTTQQLTKNDKLTTSTITRVYLRDSNQINSVNASVTVYDADPTLQPVTVQCLGVMNPKD